jgi:hypothetical protein
MRALRGLLAVLVAGLAGLILIPAVAAEAPTVFVNAKVFTGEPAAPYADAVAVRGERILAVSEAPSRLRQGRALASSTWGGASSCPA